MQITLIMANQMIVKSMRQQNLQILLRKQGKWENLKVKA